MDGGSCPSAGGKQAGELGSLKNGNCQVEGQSVFQSWKLVLSNSYIATRSHTSFRRKL